MNASSKVGQILAANKPDVVSEVAAAIPTSTGEEQNLAAPSTVRMRNASLLVIAVLLSLAAMRLASAVFIPLVMGAMFGFALAPPVKRLVRMRVPRALAAAVVMLGLAGGLGGIGYSLGDDMVTLIEGVPALAQKLRRDLTNPKAQGTASTIEKVQKAASELERTAEHNNDVPPPDRGVAMVQIEKPKFNVREYLLPGTLGLAAAAANFAVVFFIAFFLLASGDGLRGKLVKLAGPTLSKRKVTLQVLEGIGQQIQRYLLVQVFTSALVGVATWLAFMWIGVEHAAVWGIVAFVFNFIPYAGSTITTGAAMVVGFAQSGAFEMVLMIGVAGLVINLLESFVVTPLLTSRANRMSPVVIVAGVLTWGWLWGIWGLFLAVPILAVIKVICDQVDDFKGIGELLGN